VADESEAMNGSSDSTTNARPQRIILISLDTIGARNVGGYSDARTPNLEKIAKDGVRFDRFYAASTYTLPSHVSMLTGLDAIEHGVVNSPSRLAPEVPTLASELQNAGYETKAIVEGGFVKANRGFDQGFSEFTELKKHKSLVSTSVWGLLDWMRSKKEAPYFLFLHTYVAHAPYAGFDDFRNRHPELELPADDEIAELKAKYNREKHYPAPKDIPTELRHMCTFYNMNSPDVDDWIGCGDKFFWKSFLESRHFEVYREGLLEAHREGIRLGDRMVGQVRDALIELGQLEDTLLIVTSDHGEGMFEHSIHGHDYLPHDEVVKVPLFLSYPRMIPGGQVVSGLSWHLDLYPTILSLAQLPFDPGLLGEDLSSGVLQEGAIDPDRTIHPLLLRSPGRAHLPMRRMTIKGAFKFIPGSEHYGDPDGLLFDLQDSPDEVENLRTSRPEVFTELRGLALDFDAGLTPGEPIHQETGERLSPFPGEVNPFEMAPEDQKELEALGYLFDDPEES
jgi:arylsulfatase A-like enzyme